MNKKLLIIIIALSTLQLSFAQTTIKANDSHIRYIGRVILKNDSAALSWTGNAVKINFTGTAVRALLRDEHGKNYLKIIVDGKVLPDVKLDSLKHTYTLASGLPPALHTLEIWKRTEWEFGKTWFFQFELDKNAIVNKAPAANKRRIEFFGNSITCGYAVLDTTGKDRGTAEFEDGYLSYAAITARHFNADYHCTAKSGIGVMVSWFPLIMPEMYNRLDAADAQSKWDFNKYIPDVVVINLFQNDAWIVKQPNNPQFKAQFGTAPPTQDQIIKAYKQLVLNIRSKYAKAQIICALGNMDATQNGSPWPGYVEQAVAELHDGRIKSHIFPYKNTPGHPGRSEQQVMAHNLINYIENNISW